MSAGEHALDRLARRLAQRQTRGQVLRAVAGATLALPFARVASAGAVGPRRSTDGCTLALVGGPTACRKGCSYTSHVRYDSQISGCKAFGGSVAAGLLSGLFGVFGAPGMLLQGAHGVLRTIECQNQALANQKAMQLDCLQPDCPGFDPCASGGPCDGCPAYCSPCANRPDGYNCCSQPPKDGKSPCCG